MPPLSLWSGLRDTGAAGDDRETREYGEWAQHGSSGVGGVCPAVACRAVPAAGARRWLADSLVPKPCSRAPGAPFAGFRFRRAEAASTRPSVFKQAREGGRRCPGRRRRAAHTSAGSRLQLSLVATTRCSGGTASQGEPEPRSVLPCVTDVTSLFYCSLPFS